HLFGYFVCVLSAVWYIRCFLFNGSIYKAHMITIQHATYWLSMVMVQSGSRPAVNTSVTQRLSLIDSILRRIFNVSLGITQDVDLSVRNLKKTEEPPKHL